MVKLTEPMEIMLRASVGLVFVWYVCCGCWEREVVPRLESTSYVTIIFAWEYRKYHTHVDFIRRVEIIKTITLALVVGVGTRAFSFVPIMLYDIK